jgi:hypothetical protein
MELPPSPVHKGRRIWPSSPQRVREGAFFGGARHVQPEITRSQNEITLGSRMAALAERQRRMRKILGYEENSTRGSKSRTSFEHTTFRRPVQFAKSTMHQSVCRHIRAGVPPRTMRRHGTGFDRNIRGGNSTMGSIGARVVTPQTQTAPRPAAPLATQERSIPPPPEHASGNFRLSPAPGGNRWSAPAAHQRTLPLSGASLDDLDTFDVSDDWSSLDGPHRRGLAVLRSAAPERRPSPNEEEATSTMGSIDWRTYRQWAQRTLENGRVAEEHRGANVYLDRVASVPLDRTSDGKVT